MLPRTRAFIWPAFRRDILRGANPRLLKGGPAPRRCHRCVPSQIEVFVGIGPTDIKRSAIVEFLNRHGSAGAKAIMSWPSRQINATNLTSLVVISVAMRNRGVDSACSPSTAFGKSGLDRATRASHCSRLVRSARNAPAAAFGRRLVPAKRTWS